MEKLIIGNVTVYSEELGMRTPQWIIAEGKTFTWVEETTSYETTFGEFSLYLEPVDNAGNIGPESYYEIEKGKATS